MLSKPRLGVGLILVLGMSNLIASQLQAVGNPERSPALAEKEFRHPDLSIHAVLKRPNELPPQAADQARQVLDALGIGTEHAFVDFRAGRWATLLAAHPVIPGNGVGNALRWEDLGVPPPQNDAALENAARNAFQGFLAERTVELDVDVDELATQEAKVTVARGGDLVQIHVPRVVEGIPVRTSYLTAVLSHGNLVLFGAHQWGDVKVSRRPQLSAEEAMTSATEYLEPLFVSGSWAEPKLVLLPMARGQAPEHVPFGQGYEYRLSWAVYPELDGEEGDWETLVDAHDGEVLAFEDTRHYVATDRRVQGGVYPVSNDGQAPDGVEQAGWPMPFDDVTTPSGTVVTDSGGNLPDPVDGTITASLSGPYIHMNDLCGPISLSSTGDVDFGTSSGTDCTTPGYGGAGNTHSSRSGFYELNRIKEIARSHLPSNTWLQQTLQSNMNINSACNAYWNGTVNFFRSSTNCGNTGEIAAVFDHEWGHGMDANDATPGISYPGEGIADLYAALRLNTSCIGRGFWLNQNCTGYGDPCIDCSGIRDIDYAMRVSGLPHTYTWANGSYCGSVHCKGAVYAEAVWDLWKRDLPAAPYSMDDNTAMEVVTRLTYLGAGGVGTWFSGGPPWGGCAATSGYMKFLAADDDNGNTTDGTPHMTAIYSAFNRHEIACSTPTVQDSGCAGTPTIAPVVTASPQDRAADLSWNAVSGATKYQVFRTDSVFDCSFGKEKVGETTSTSFGDSGLQNGREYSYVVIPIGAADTCMGPASSCAQVVPVEDPVPPGYYRCIVDVDAGTSTCDDSEVTLTTNSGIYRVAKIDMDGYLRMDAIVDICSPSGYATHFTDSPSGNGWGGDSGHTTHDAEAQLYYNDFSFWGPYDYARYVAEPVLLEQDVVAASGCYQTHWSIQEDVLRFDDDGDPADSSKLVLNSFNSFELAPYDEADSEDPGGLYADLWYAGLNRTVGSSSRSGTGVGRACFVLSDTVNPDPAILADLCAAN